MTILINLFCLFSLIVLINGDCYLHNPRGSNNRLNERSANRRNANRLFDSQNNNRGGHNVCDCDPVKGFEQNTWMATATEKYDWRFLYATENNNNAAANKLRKQYEEIYFENSWLSATWTNQHGAGNKKLMSQIILQFGCDTVARPAKAQTAGNGPLGVGNACSNNDCTSNWKRKLIAHGLRMELMNGGNTNTPNDANSVTNVPNTYNNNNQQNRGRHESEEYYQLCESRSRQYGLFHADQRLNGKTQKYTRQNPGGNRRGLECPEERDYYPWWNPSPWHDIAILTHDEAYCKKNVAPFSQNVHPKCQCLSKTYHTGDGAKDIFAEKNVAAANLDSAKCTTAGGLWKCIKWNAAAPQCVTSPWTRVNYLGNVDGTLNGGKQATYDWKLPAYSDLTSKHFCHAYTETIEAGGKGSIGGTKNFDFGGTEDGNGQKQIKCVRMVFRIRYNISTADYDPYKTSFEHDYKPKTGILSPIEQNPDVQVSRMQQPLRLAINTAQTGRTFQDRTHSFLVCETPAAGKKTWGFQKKLYNVNVRGKRGNIVQTFPATEYDFEPQHLELKPHECLHFQWCGSNTHNNGRPAGDGQAGDAGEGRGGSDRSNLVQTREMSQSYPLAYDKLSKSDDDFFNHVECYYPLSGSKPNKADAQLNLGTGGFYKSVAYMKRVITEVNNSGDLPGKAKDAIMDELMNNVSASYRVGLICCVKTNAVTKAGTKERQFSFISTRNNNFTNRSQKLKIIISLNPKDHTKW